MLEDSRVNFTWKKDNRQLQANSDVSISSASLNEQIFRSNLTIHVLDRSDDGIYSCSVVLLLESFNEPVSSATSNIYLNVEGNIIYLRMHLST